MTYGRLEGLPFVVCDKLATSFLSVLGQNDNRSTLSLILAAICNLVFDAFRSSLASTIDGSVGEAIPHVNDMF